MRLANTHTSLSEIVNLAFHWTFKSFQSDLISCNDHPFDKYCTFREVCFFCCRMGIQFPFEVWTYFYAASEKMIATSTDLSLVFALATKYFDFCKRKQQKAFAANSYGRLCGVKKGTKEGLDVAVILSVISFLAIIPNSCLTFFAPR